MQNPLDDPIVRRTAIGVALGILAALAVVAVAAFLVSLALNVPGGYIALPVLVLVAVLALVLRYRRRPGR